MTGPELPAGFGYLWSWFLELNAARIGNGFGPNSIGYGELLAWTRLTGRRPSAWEVETLRRLDAAYLAVAATRKG